MRIMGWLAKVMGLVLLVTTLTVMTTGIIVDSYIQSLLKKFGVQLEGKPFALSDVWGGLLGTGRKAPQADGTRSSAAPKGEAVPAMGGVTVSPESGAGGGKASAGSPDARSSSAGAGSSAAPVGGGNTPGAASPGVSGTGSEGSATDTAQPGSTPGTKDDVVISRDALAQAKDNLSAADKEQLFSLLISKIPADELQKISTAVEGGLTESELKEIEQIIAKYVSDKEYDKLMGMLKKYQ